MGVEDEQERIAVRAGLGGGRRADRSRAARPVIHDELVAERRAQPLAYQARERVNRATGREWDDERHRLGRPAGILRSSGRQWRKHASRSDTPQAYRIKK